MLCRYRVHCCRTFLELICYTEDIVSYILVYRLMRFRFRIFLAIYRVTQKSLLLFWKFITRQLILLWNCVTYEMKDKILKFNFWNMLFFKCFSLLFKHKRILRTVFSMTFSKISGVILLISLMVLFINYKQMIHEYLLPQLEDLDM